jgi:hypothetical protein
MFSIYISDFSILLSQLHVIIIKFIVIDNLINLFNPFIVHKHLVITISDSFLSGDKLLVLGL